MSTAPLVHKVAAFVIRKTAGERAQLLVYVPDDNPTLSPRVPGGGVEEGEVPEDAVLRELFEEAGMTALPVVRRLGVQRYYKPYTQRFVERYDYLLFAPGDVPDRWQHKVVGKGGDAGDVLSLSWIDEGAFGSVDEEHRVALTPSYLPELFDLQHLG